MRAEDEDEEEGSMRSGFENLRESVSLGEWFWVSLDDSAAAAAADDDDDDDDVVAVSWILYFILLF